MSDQDREASSSLEQQQQQQQQHRLSLVHINTEVPAGVAAGSEHQDAIAVAGGEASQPPAHHPPPFEPLFTLLTNTTTNATVHPRVHYLFSDDDTSVLAAPQDNPSHRTLIVDLAAPTAPNGAWSISWASSLSPDFAVTSSHLSTQQQHDDGRGQGDDDDSASSTLMLRVEGVEREPVDSQPSSMPDSASEPVVLPREDTEGLAEEFKRRMGVLKKVVVEGEKRREMLDQQHVVEGLTVADHHHQHKTDDAAEKEIAQETTLASE